ncbi:mediator of RNA polymerase II transcription subunit 26 isoform X2 [Protopterus annectens]|uniref:mediator of RNA polymerase II transcription subunit 26 isoform X2 n=1 Tax=Protopterus annectens TaxID=7888 RepID=UPI001CF9470D|nr:mediator of RNA polymerase II transcription subunit 26 isoform X2 [Protopterus annectens]
MTAALATPQQIRDRLLQAIDTQSNICNMVAVMEVISSLEKYPITKEALEETRLGKLINDVRKKTTNEDLAKRAKKLLRNWQKLIEPVVQNEQLPRPNPPGSANGGALNCKPEIQSPIISGGTKPIQELKTRNDIQNLNSPKEKLGNRKRKGDLKDGIQGPPSKVSKPNCEQLQNCSPVPSNGVGGSPGGFPSVRDVTSANAHNSPERNRLEHLENDKHSKIPINAVKPHTSSPGLVKMSSTSSLLKTSVLQQLEKSEETSGQCQPRSPRCPSFSPRNIKQDASVKRQTTYAPKGTVSSPLPLSDSYVPSPLPLTQPSTPPVSAKKLEGSQQPESEMPAHCAGHVGVESPHRPTAGTLQHNTPLHSSHSLKMGLHQGEPVTPRTSGYTPDASKGDSDDAASGSDSKKKKYRPRDHRTNLEERTAEGKKPSVKLKERKLTFDHITRQIIPLTNKEPSQVSSSAPAPAVQHRTEPERQETKVAPQSPFEQTNWKELSKNGIIASYLNRQSNLLSTSGAQTPGAHYFMSEYLKQEESTRREARKTGILVCSTPVDLPGVSNDITDDLRKVHEQHWSGVNGCYDTQGNWYDWTQCISVDPHGDDGRLNILPYVCLD